MGVATTRSLERVMAAMGLLGEVPLQFEVADDVPQGGVLCALPALLAFGLLRHTRERFSLPAGYYPLEIYFLVVSFLALARVGSLEALRYEPPGEWGKLLGLDRVPEVRTLRQKLGQLCQPGGRVQQWSQTLSQEWMEGSGEVMGTAYVDGHVRVYHGKLTPLPRRYVARERLCLRGTTDYWVNAMDGQPFFAVTQAVDPGLLSVLRQSIIPRLQRELPGQPSAEQLAADPYLSRFTLVCDRAVLLAGVFRRGQGGAGSRHHLSQISWRGLGGAGVLPTAGQAGQWGGRRAGVGGARDPTPQRFMGPGGAAAGELGPPGFGALD